MLLNIYLKNQLKKLKTTTEDDEIKRCLTTLNILLGEHETNKIKAEMLKLITDWETYW